MPSPSSEAKSRVGNIVLGVSGGIAAYKTCELVRLFVRFDYEVRVIMTKKAESFVGPLTFASLSRNPVLRSLGADAYDLSATAHIDLAQWADIFVVAPASANTLAKFAHGLADDALATEALAMDCPRLLAPAMNSRMWNAPATQRNLSILRENGWNFVGPNSGELACRESGIGKMSEASEIFDSALALLGENWLKQQKVLISSGPTRAYLDPVRFLTNRSSGRMGHALAMAAERAGADVVLVSGPVADSFATLRRGRVIRVETNAEMQSALEAEVQDSNIIFGAAAVVDYQPLEREHEKIQRQERFKLDLRGTVDILASLAARRKKDQLFIGFAAEQGSAAEMQERALAKLERKNLDYLVLNNIGRSDIGFDANDNEVIVFGRSLAEPAVIYKAAKSRVAEEILRIVARAIEKRL